MDTKMIMDLVNQQIQAIFDELIEEKDKASARYCNLAIALESLTCSKLNLQNTLGNEADMEFDKLWSEENLSSVKKMTEQMDTVVKIVDYALGEK